LKPPPPPLLPQTVNPESGVAHGGDVTKQFSPIREFSLRDDLSKYEKNIESLNEKEFMKSPATRGGQMPTFPTAFVTSTQSKTEPNTLPPLRPAMNAHLSVRASRADTMDHHAFLTTSRYDGRMPFPGLCLERPVGFNEENCAIRAFSSHAGVVHSTHADLPSPRLPFSGGPRMSHFPVSAASIASSQSSAVPLPVFPTSMAQVRHHHHHPQPAPDHQHLGVGFVRSKSPNIMSAADAQQQQRQPVIHPPPPYTSTMSQEEILARHQMELHLQKQHQQHHLSESTAGRDPSEVYQEEIEKKEKQRLLAQKILEHGTMSKEQIEELAKSSFDNASACSPTSQLVMPDDLHQHHHHQQQHQQQQHQYLRNLPKQPHGRSELTQRAASIPDLRSFNPDRQGFVASGMQQHASGISRFEEAIIKTKVPLAPLSRPGSAELLENSSYRYPKRPSSSNDFQQHRSHSPEFENLKRRAAIVRPWEIDEQPSRESTSPFLGAQSTPPPPPIPAAIHSPKPPPNASRQPQIHHQHPLQPKASFIQLSASNKYKAEIIHFAKQHSPAPETNPKFRYDNVPPASATAEATLSKSNNNSTERAQQFRPQRIASDQSLSPTFPMTDPALNKPSSTVTSATAIAARTRSDSEETLSADEDENKHHAQAQAAATSTILPTSFLQSYQR